MYTVSVIKLQKRVHPEARVLLRKAGLLCHAHAQAIIFQGKPELTC